MKTPMQELLEWVKATLPMDLDTPRLIEQKIESMLEKEKEYFIGYGFECCLMTKQKKPWSLEELFNKTFNTKEK